ncbi:hypothetical protein LCGC14_2931290, partial [marine sediment metagenome]
VFKIVSVKGDALVSTSINRKIIEANVKEGIIRYINNSGGEAVFEFTETIKGIEKDFNFPINFRELDLKGCKFAWCDGSLLSSTSGYIKYYPEESFHDHPYNCYKFKPNSVVQAELINDKAYVITKQKRRKKKI